MASKNDLSTKDLQTAFKVGHMTIYNWRQGSATRDPLPCHVDEETKRVTFRKPEVKAWAKKYSLMFTEPTEKAEEVKPGPKPKASTKIDHKKEPKRTSRKVAPADNSQATAAT